MANFKYHADILADSFKALQEDGTYKDLLKTEVVYSYIDWNCLTEEQQNEIISQYDDVYITD